MTDSYNRDQGTGNREQGTEQREQGAGKITEREKGLAWMVDMVRRCRVEYEGMNTTAIENVLKACGKPEQLPAAVEAWAADHANALKPFDNPLASLRKAVERISEPAREKGKPASDKHESVWVIKERIAAAQHQMKCLPTYGQDRTEEESKRYKELQTKIRNWNNQIAQG